MAKNYTLYGRMNQIIKSVESGTIPSSEEIQSMVETATNKAIVESKSTKVDEPTTLEIDSNLFFFANGTPITITERTDGEEGALITWLGGSLAVGPTSNIFGGRHDDDSATIGAVTMTGGTVKNVVAGGMHKSHTTKGFITMTGGTVTGSVFASASSFNKKCGCENGTTWYSGDPAGSPCVVDECHLDITGGSAYLVYGGGEGISYTKKAVTTIGGDFKATYVTTGGSNGGTDETIITINGNPEIGLLQGVNRGYVGKTTMTINGGIIDKMFVGIEIPYTGTAEKPNQNENGKLGSAVVTINGGIIAEFSYGGSNFTPIAEDPEMMKNVSLTINDSKAIDVFKK
jgi:hypothetical protein